MSLEVLRTKWKATLDRTGNRVLRLSVSNEGIFYIFLEYMDENDMVHKKSMLWNSEGEWELNFGTTLGQENSFAVWNQCLVPQEDIAKAKFENFKDHL